MDCDALCCDAVGNDLRDEDPGLGLLAYDGDPEAAVPLLQQLHLNLLVGLVVLVVIAEF
jgi:hypothetical protein